MPGLNLPMNEVAYNVGKYEEENKRPTGFSQHFCVHITVDIEELIYKWTQDAKLINTLHDCLTFEEYALINMIVTEGLNNILAQEPDIEEPGEDFDAPGISLPEIDPDNPDGEDPDNPDGEDPSTPPEGWTPSAGIFYDPETGNLIDKDGNILKEPDEKTDHPYWGMWVRYYNIKYPETRPEDIPAVVENPNNPDFEDFMNWMQEDHGNTIVGGGEISTPDLL